MFRRNLLGLRLRDRCHSRTGAIVVEKYTIAVDPGIVVNPMQLKRNVEGGAVMGIGHALFEEVAFDESRITTDDWLAYPIPDHV
jgi:nicotinate dehydrogenase subunit B